LGFGFLDRHLLLCLISLNIGDPKTHLTLILLWQAIAWTLKRSSTAELAMIPARLTALVGHQAGLTHLLGRQKLVIHHNH
jgi:hypothetical protein